MLDRQGGLGKLFYPQGLFDALALWTVTVATTVVTIAYLSAAGARFFVPAQCCCTALNYVKQGFCLLGRQLLLLKQFFAKPAYHIGKLKLTFHDGCTGYQVDCVD